MSDSKLLIGLAVGVVVIYAVGINTVKSLLNKTASSNNASSSPSEYVTETGSIDVDKLVENDTTAKDEFNMSPYR
jgi:hypothetical protein